MRKKRKHPKVEERNHFCSVVYKIISQKPLIRYKKKDPRTGRTLEKESEYVTKTWLRNIRREIRTNWHGFRDMLFKQAPFNDKRKILRLEKDDVLRKCSARDWNKMGFIANLHPFYQNYEAEKAVGKEPAVHWTERRPTEKATKQQQATIERKLRILRKKSTPS